MSANPAGIGVTPYTDSTQGPIWPQHISWLDAIDFIAYPSGLNLTPNSPIYLNGTLQKICDAACVIVEKYCNSYFSYQTIDEQSPDIRIRAEFYTAVSLENMPIAQVNNIWLQVFKYFIPTSLEYMTLFPQAGYYQLIPFLTSTMAGGGMFVPNEALNAGEVNFWTNYTFGYTEDTLPDDLYFATTLVATKLIGFQQNPIGATSMEMGRTRFEWRYALGQDDPTTRQIKDLLIPYKTLQFYST